MNDIWAALHTRAVVLAATETLSRPLLMSAILRHESFAAALTHWLAMRLRRSAARIYNVSATDRRGL